MLTKTKENIAKPKITPAQLILFGLLMGWIILTNLNQFKDLAVSWQIGIQIIFYLAIMLTAGMKGNVSSLVRSLIGIIVNGDPDEIKMMKLQNLVVAICQELGLLYEQEKEKFFEYIEGTDVPSTEVETLKAELATLEADDETA